MHWYYRITELVYKCFMIYEWSITLRYIKRRKERDDTRDPNISLVIRKGWGGMEFIKRTQVQAPSNKSNIEVIDKVEKRSNNTQTPKQKVL